MIPTPPSSPERFGPAISIREKADYLACGSESIHYVEHLPEGNPLATIVLAGPLPDERTHSHLTWVRWARVLAKHGYLVMRFDYSGTGESTGKFQKTTLSTWATELAACAEYMKRERESGPVILHGLRVGGLVSTRTFADGIADSLLTWEPCRSGEALLLDAARRQQAANMVQGISGGTPGPRAIKTRLRDGLSTEINGYTWSPEFWFDAKSWRLEQPDSTDLRPCLHLQLKRGTSRPKGGRSMIDLPTRSDFPNEAVAISWPPFWVVGHRLMHEVDELFERSLLFIQESTHSTRTEGS